MSYIPLNFSTSESSSSCHQVEQVEQIPQDNFKIIEDPTECSEKFSQVYEINQSCQQYVKNLSQLPTGRKLMSRICYQAKKIEFKSQFKIVKEPEVNFGSQFHISGDGGYSPGTISIQLQGQMSVQSARNAILVRGSGNKIGIIFNQPSVEQVLAHELGHALHFLESKCVGDVQLHRNVTTIRFDRIFDGAFTQKVHKQLKRQEIKCGTGMYQMYDMWNHYKFIESINILPEEYFVPSDKCTGYESYNCEHFCCGSVSGEQVQQNVKIPKRGFATSDGIFLRERLNTQEIDVKEHPESDTKFFKGYKRVLLDQKEEKLSLTVAEEDITKQVVEAVKNTEEKYVMRLGHLDGPALVKQLGELEVTEQKNFMKCVLDLLGRTESVETERSHKTLINKLPQVPDECMSFFVDYDFE